MKGVIVDGIVIQERISFCVAEEAYDRVDEKKKYDKNVPPV